MREVVVVVVEWNRRSILHGGVDDFGDVVQTGDDFDDNLADDAQIDDVVGVGAVDECCLFDASHNVDHHYDDVDHDDESDGSMMTVVDCLDVGGCIFGHDVVIDVDVDENN